MKILYGVVGEGMGHAIRSRVVIERLLSMGHEVEVVVSGRAADYLSKRMPDVKIRSIHGLSIAMEDNEVSILGTAKALIDGALGKLVANNEALIGVEEEFGPEVVVSDFETATVLYGHNHFLPVICLDNIQAVRRLWHPPEILRGKMTEWRTAKAVIKAKVPRANHYLISTFFDAAIKRERTSLVPPILRPEIINATPTNGKHVLVYQTSESFVGLPEVLSGFDLPFRIYGLRRDLEAPVEEGNLTFCPFSEEGFINDLASCQGVIASAGFTLVTEALHLGKPYLATPVKGQFEQTMNARYIEHLNYGLSDEELDEFTVQTFLAHIPDYRQSLASYESLDNEPMFAALSAQLDKAAAGL